MQSSLKSQIEKEFEKKFDHYNPIHDIGERTLAWNGADFENIKAFFLFFLDRMEKEAYDEGYRDCKVEYDELES